VITIPENLWLGMLTELSTEKRQVEQVCYFDGVLIDNAGVVTTMTIPHAKLEVGRFHVEPKAMNEAGKHLRAHRLRRLAQVHTHPTEWTGHSPWDNEWAYSQLPGAISIVLPHFGRTRPRLEQAGVHLRSSAGWRQLTLNEVPQYLRLVPGVLDFRRTNEPARIKSARRRPWWSVFAFWQY
jgi:hypothetical protein